MKNGQNSRQIGDRGEDAVCEFLSRHGYDVVTRNFTIRGGEIDVIARKAGILAFVEVKTRKYGALSDGESAVTEGKRRRLAAAAEYFLNKYYPGGDYPQCRFDVAAVTLDNGRVTGLKYYVAAFDGSRR